MLGFRGTPEAGPTEAFDRELAAHRLRVRTVHERVWFRPLLGSLSGAGPLGELAAAERLEAFGFADVERTRQAVAELTRGLTRSSRMMQQLLPLLLDWLSASPDPDLGLLGLRRLASGEERSSALATTFRDSPEAARHLALAARDEPPARRRARREPRPDRAAPGPDRLRTPSAGRPRGQRARRDLVARATARSSSARCSGGSSATWSAWRRATCSATRRWSRSGADLTRLAEATLEGALESLDPQVPFAVVAFGRLGGGELGYASDLDLAFVHDGARRVAEAERVADGLLRFVGGRHAGRAHLGRRRRPPARGPERPAGAQRSRAGRATSRAGCRPGSARRTSRVRAVAGDADLGAAARRPHPRPRAGERPLTGDDEREVRRMKVRIEQERLAPGDDPEFHLKLGTGLARRTSSSPCSCSSSGTACVEPSTMARPRRAGGGRPPPARGGRGARGGVPLLRGHPEPHLPRGGRRRRAPHPSRAGHPGRPLARAHRDRAPGASTAGSPGGRGAWWSAASTARRDGRWACAMMSRRPARGARDAKGTDVPLHPQVKVLLDGMAQAGRPAARRAVARTTPGRCSRGLIALDQPEEVTRVDDRLVPGDGVDVPVRVYTPADAVGGDAPLLLWLHGGGWVIGDLDTADATARALANRSGAVVVSVDYRLAPEHPRARGPRGLPGRAHLVRSRTPSSSASTPAGWRWAATRPAATSPRASASGCATSSGPTSTSSSSCTPSPTARSSHPSIDENAEGYFLTKATMEWFVGHYLGDGDPKDPSRVAAPRRLARGPPARAGDHRRVRSAARRGRGLRRRRCATRACRWSAVRYDGQIHGFFGLAGRARGRPATPSTAPAPRCEPRSSRP